MLDDFARIAFKVMLVFVMGAVIANWINPPPCFATVIWLAAGATGIWVAWRMLGGGEG